MGLSCDTVAYRAFIQLGKHIEQWLGGAHDDEFDVAVDLAHRRNGWFTHENIRFAFSGLASMLQENSLDTWLNNYELGGVQSAKTVGVVSAGNIPLVGFHDLLCVLVSGHSYLGKLSSKDDCLLQALVKRLIVIEPHLADRVTFTPSFLTGFDAVIATGSNNSARYFDYYFSRFPSVIRRNRTSVAVLTGSESDQELELLGSDVFTYFGLGCRNVSKVYIPKGYDVAKLCKAFERFKELGMHSKFANNYDYNKSLYLLNKVPFYDLEFAMLREESSLFSPISVVFYEQYDNLLQLQTQLAADSERIQCIVSSQSGFYKTPVAFGDAQKPGVGDYADDVDTLKFLTYLN